MADRRWLGDIGLAVLLALPTAVLARQPEPLKTKVAVAQVEQSQQALTLRSSIRSRFAYFG